MSIYLDASAIVALFVPDSLSARAHGAISGSGKILLVSDYAALEFASSIGRFARTKVLTGKDARVALGAFDEWVRAACEKVETAGSDIAAAEALVRREDIALRTSDAVHVAIAQRLEASLLTFDKKLAGNARRLGLDIA